jgi:hypothetical protein
MCFSLLLIIVIILYFCLTRFLKPEVISLRSVQRFQKNILTTLPSLYYITTMGGFLVAPQEDNLAVHACAGWLTEGLDRLWVGRHGWWWLGRAACSDRLFLLGNALLVNRRFGHRPTGGLAGGLLGAGHPLFAVHVSVDQFTWSGHIFEAGSDFAQIGPAVSAWAVSAWAVSAWGDLVTWCISGFLF